MNIWLSLSKALNLYADRKAIVDGDKSFTYRQFGRRVADLARFLLSCSLSKGSVVAVAAPNGHEYMELYYACAIAGIVLNPLNFRLSEVELSAIINDAESRVLVVHSDFAGAVEKILEDCPGLEMVVWLGQGPRPSLKVPAVEFEHCAASGDGQMPLLPQMSFDDLAHLYYTSGTTGRPKGVMLTQGNVACNAMAAAMELNFRDSDTWLHVAPMFHLADAWAAFAVTWTGGRHVFLPYFKAQAVLSAIEKEKVTATILVPTMLHALLNEPALSDCDFSSLRLLITAGSPIAPESVRRVVSTFACEYVQLYGMTETSPFLTLSLPKSHQLDLPPDRLLEIRSRTGRPYIGAEVKVVRPDGSQVANDDREIGEIIARGPTIFAGYWKQPQVTAETLRDGWIYTGDLAVVDAEGSINIVDRKKDMIITGGENVYSTEVEYTLHEHPGVAEVAVIGIPDEFWGEAVKAVVVSRQGHQLTEAELMDFVRQRLAHYKVPRSIDFLPELPKTGSGKIYKKGLREKYWQKEEKKVH